MAFVRIKHPCTICKRLVHSSNRKIECLLCHNLAHVSCLNVSANSVFYCVTCMSDILPFMNLEVVDDDCFRAQQLTFVDNDVWSLSSRIAGISDKKFNLNPFENIDNGFIDSDDIDADVNYYNHFATESLGYLDTDQVNERLCTDISKLSMMHINAGDLKSKIDLLCANLKLLKTKFSIIAVTEVWTDLSTEGFIDIPGYTKLVKSRNDGRKGGGVALYIDSELNLIVRHRPDLETTNTTLYESLFIQVSQPAHPSAKNIVFGVVQRFSTCGPRTTSGPRHSAWWSASKA